VCEAWLFLITRVTNLLAACIYRFAIHMDV